MTGRIPFAPFGMDGEGGPFPRLKKCRFKQHRAEPSQADRKKRRCKQKGAPKANAFGAPFLNGSSATFPVCSSTIEKGYSEKIEKMYF